MKTQYRSQTRRALVSKKENNYHQDWQKNNNKIKNQIFRKLFFQIFFFTW